MPNFFPRNCARDTTAEYVLREDGLIDVTNRLGYEPQEFVRTPQTRAAAR